MGQHCCPNFLDSCLSADFEVAGVVSVFLLCRLPKTRVLLCYSLCLANFDHPAQILPIEAPLAIGVWAREPRPWAQHGHRHPHGHGHEPGHGHGHWRGQIRPQQKKITQISYESGLERQSLLPARITLTSRRAFPVYGAHASPPKKPSIHGTSWPDES